MDQNGPPLFWWRLTLRLIAGEETSGALDQLGVAQGNAETGGAIAERWCASCHLASADQTAAVADIPSFPSIAQRTDSEIEALEGFLADPHPPMPDMSLTRSEIRDLLAYIRSLRE